jgi:hypothetical protein
MVRIARHTSVGERQRWVILPPNQPLDAVLAKHEVVKGKVPTHHIEVAVQIDTVARTAIADVTRMPQSAPLTSHILQLAADAMLVYMREVGAIRMDFKDPVLGMHLSVSAQEAKEADDVTQLPDVAEPARESADPATEGRT